MVLVGVRASVVVATRRLLIYTPASIVCQRKSSANLLALRAAVEVLTRAVQNQPKARKQTLSVPIRPDRLTTDARIYNGDCRFLSHKRAGSTEATIYNRNCRFLLLSAATCRCRIHATPLGRPSKSRRFVETATPCSVLRAQATGRAPRIRIGPTHDRRTD